MLSKILVLVLSIFAVILWAALPATDSFTDADTTTITAHNGSWTVYSETFRINTNRLYPDLAKAERSFAHWDGDTFSNDQYSQVRVAQISNFNSQIGVGVRMAHGSNAGYFLLWQESHHLWLCRRYGEGTGVLLAELASTILVNDVLRLEVSGTTLIAKQNGGVVIGPITDTVFTSGSAGVAGQDASNDLANVGMIDDWQAGDLGGGRRKVVVIQ